MRWTLQRWLGALLLVLALQGAAQADRRVAFPVGNGAYRHATPLPNPPLDAHAIRDTLTRPGFEAVYGEDLDRKPMGRAVVLQAAKGVQRPTIEIALNDNHMLDSPLAQPGPVETAPPLGPTQGTGTQRPREPSAEPAWSASASDIAAWRIKVTTRIGGALSNSATNLDRSLIAATAEREGNLHVLDAATLKPRAKIALADYEPYSLGGIAILPGGQRVAVVRNGVLEVYDVASQALVQSIPAIGPYTKGIVTIAKDGQHLYFDRISISPQASIVSRFVLEGSTLVPDTDFPFSTRVDSFDVSADGTRFLLGTFSNEIVLFDAGARRPLWSVKCSCSARFGAQESLVVFAGRIDADAGNYGKPSVIGVLDVADPARRAVFRTGSLETLEVQDVTPDGRYAAIGSTNDGRVTIVPVTLDQPELRPVTILKDRTRQSIRGANFVDRDALVTISGDNNARLWRK